MSQREPPSLLELNKAGTASRLRRVKKEIEGAEDGEGELTVTDEGIGYEEMKGICEKHNNGMVVIRNGIMERMCAKSEKPDVILDEDLDHFYLNGVGQNKGEDGVLINKVAFWNCNGWGVNYM